MVTYIAPALPPRTALGRVARRDGLQEGLAHRGVAPTSRMITSRWDRLPTYFQLLPSVPAILSMRRELEADRDSAVILEGADVAVAYFLAYAGRRRPAVRVHVDVCDSILLLAQTVNGGVRKSSLKTRLKLTLGRIVLRITSSVADSISYISERDLGTDARLVSATSALSVVRMARHSHGRANWDAEGPFVVIGDWGYSPNRQMLIDVLAWLGDWGAELPERLRVVGPNLPFELRDGEFNYVGWVDRLEEGFDGTCCALAPLAAGAGVKNKVMDAIAYGLPVVGTEEALNGVPVSPTVRLLTDDMGPDEVRLWLRDLGRVEVADDPGWGAAVGPIIDSLSLTREEGV